MQEECESQILAFYLMIGDWAVNVHCDVLLKEDDIKGAVSIYYSIIFCNKNTNRILCTYLKVWGFRESDNKCNKVCLLDK